MSMWNRAAQFAEAKEQITSLEAIFDLKVQSVALQCRGAARSRGITPQK